MNFIVDSSTIDWNHLFVTEKKKNIVIDGHFCKLIYSDESCITNGIFIHVENFKTLREENVSKQINYNVLNGIHPFSPRGKIRGLMKVETRKFQQIYRPNPKHRPESNPTPTPTHSPKPKSKLTVISFNRPRFGINMMHIPTKHN